MLLSNVLPRAVNAPAAAAGHGSGSPLASVEWRHFGGAIAVRPPTAGAVGHFQAGFAIFAIGITDAASEDNGRAHVRVVEHAPFPCSAEFLHASFDERLSGGRERFHDWATLRRLHAVKVRCDPNNFFISGHPVVPHEDRP